MNNEMKESYPNEYLINFIKNFNITENKDNLKDKEELTDLFIKIQTKGFYSFVNINVQDNIVNQPSILLDIPSNLFSSEIDYNIPNKLPEIIPTVKDYIRSIYTSIYGEKSHVDSIVDSIYTTENALNNLYQESVMLSIMSMYEKMDSNNTKS